MSCLKLKSSNVNLQHSSGAKANVALHIKPRYDAEKLVMVLNSRQNGTYGLEKKYFYPLFPVVSSFSLSLRVSQENYFINVDGSRFEPFQHHTPFSLVDKLEVNGDVEIFSVASCCSAESIIIIIE